jgi:hypothetical protein
MPKAEEIVLRSSLSAEECLKRLQDSTDPGSRTIFSLSGYSGSKSFLVKFKGNQFRLWKRRFYRNDFAPNFYGTVSSENQGTCITGQFDMERKLKWIFPACFVLFSLEVIATNLPVSENAWTDIIVLLTVVTLGVVVPKFGRLANRGDEKVIEEFLETTLEAHPENQFTVSQRTIENRSL